MDGISEDSETISTNSNRYNFYFKYLTVETNSTENCRLSYSTLKFVDYIANSYYSFITEET